MATNISTASVSRRDFLKLAGILGVSTMGLAGCAPDSTSSTSSSDSGVKKISIAGSSATPPYSYLDDSGNLTGFDIETLKKVDEYLDDYEFEYSGMEFSAMLTALESGNVELATCEFCPNEARKQKYIFCSEAFNIMPMVFVTADENIKTLDDLAGKSTIMNPSNYEYTLIDEYNKKHPDKALDLQTIGEVTMADAFKMVASGQADSYFISDAMYESVSEETGVKLYCSDVVMCESAYFMLNREQQELADAIDGALKKMKEDGSLSMLSTDILGVDAFAEYDGVLTDAEILS